MTAKKLYMTQSDANLGATLVAKLLAEEEILNVAPFVAAVIITLKLGNVSKEEAFHAFQQAWDSIEIKAIMDAAKGIH